MIYKRTIEEKLLDACFKGKVIIIYGARQVGKTTLCKKLWGNDPKTLWVTGDDFSVVQKLTNASLIELQQWVQGYRMVIIDEAQKIQTIGNTLKLIVDNISDVQVIATGSSSFDLANHLQEPLTGRSITFHLHPLTLEEIRKGIPSHTRSSLLPIRIIYGMYPAMVQSNLIDQLFSLVSAYAYKDIFLYENLRKPDLIIKLLQALALQIGSEVSYNELSQLLQVDVKTIQKYLGLLEQAFIIFRLPSLARNMRNELKRSQKIYFWDTGVRNGLLQNVQGFFERTDQGALRENFILSERIKYNQNHHIYTNTFFWRTNTGQEIDYIETDHASTLYAYEIKRSPSKKISPPGSFLTHYPQATYSLINSENYISWVL